MADDNFADYQALRAKFEKEIRAEVFGWALGEAPDTMTLDQVRTLTDSFIRMMNGATRQCWDLGLRNSNT